MSNDLHGRIMNLPHHAASRTEHWLDYAEGYRDARHAAAEIASEADATIAELVAALTIHHEWSARNLKGYSEDGAERVAYRATVAALARVKGQA